MYNSFNINTSTQNSFTNFAYNGMKLDNEVSGNGNSYTTLFRELDMRLGRWWAVDPKSEQMPWQSSYNSMDNNPIWHNDPLGDWVKGAGFWKNVTSSDAKIKAKEYASKNGGIATRKGFGKWDVVKTEETRISNNEGKTRLEYNTEIRSFNKENSNDLTDHGNAFFNFMGLLDYGVSNLRGSKDNYGEFEGGAEGGNIDYGYVGEKGMAKGLNEAGINLSYTPLAPLGGALCITSDLIETHMDVNTNKNNALNNAKIRITTTLIGIGIGKFTAPLKPSLKTPLEGALNHTGEAIEDNLTK